MSLVAPLVFDRGVGVPDRHRCCVAPCCDRGPGSALESRRWRWWLRPSCVGRRAHAGQCERVDRPSDLGPASSVLASGRRRHRPLARRPRRRGDRGHAWPYVIVGGGQPIYAERTFFGVYRVTPMTASGTRSVHGTTVHGVQFTDPSRKRDIATTYYHASGTDRAGVRRTGGTTRTDRRGRTRESARLRATASPASR